MDKKELMAHFRSPAWVTYLSPFTLIVPDDEEPIKFDLNEINSNTYNHGFLCRIISHLNIDAFNYTGIVCYDGAVAIPKTGRFAEKEKAVDYFNNLFCKLLIGGFFCEAIDRKDVVNGQLHEKKFIWPVDFGQSTSTNLHSKLRMRVGGAIDAIMLSNPKCIKLNDFHRFILAGEEVLKTISNVTPKFLIRGITEIKYRNWDLVLSNLWITVEQLIDFIWHNHFLKNQLYHSKSVIDGRKVSFKEDNRTWSTSVKQEILFQAKLIDEDIISKLFPARRSRNKLVHEGKNVSQEVAVGLYEAVQMLIAKSANMLDIQLPDVNVDTWEFKTEKFDYDDDFFTDWKKTT